MKHPTRKLSLGRETLHALDLRQVRGAGLTDGACTNGTCCAWSKSCDSKACPTREFCTSYCAPTVTCPIQPPK